MLVAGLDIQDRKIQGHHEQFMGEQSIGCLYASSRDYSRLEAYTCGKAF